MPLWQWNKEARSNSKVFAYPYWLADDPWAPGPQEDDEVEKIVLEEMALAAIPTGADEKRKYDNTVVLYQRALTLLRQLLNQHTFLRAVYHTSSRQAQNKYKEI